jgi:hypothetical protein
LNVSSTYDGENNNRFEPYPIFQFRRDKGSAMVRRLGAASC